MKKRAIIYNQNKTMQQKNYSELTRHTATLITVLLQPTGASHKHLHKPNEKKKESRLPLARRPSLRDRSSSPSGVGHWARACTCTRRWSIRSDGIVVKGGAPSRLPSLGSAGCSSRHLPRPSKPTMATGLRRREESDQVHPRTRAQETRAHPDEERGCSPATNTRATGERQERNTRDQ